MTPTERKYKDILGKLFIYKERIWVGRDLGYVFFNHLVMPSGMDKRGGWWHYNLDVLRYNLDNEADFPQWKTEHNNIVVGCTEFGRQSFPAALSPHCDTFNKEVA